LRIGYNKIYTNGWTVPIHEFYVENNGSERNTETNSLKTDSLLITYFKKADDKYITKVQWKHLNYQLIFEHSKFPYNNNEESKNLLVSTFSIFTSLLEKEYLLIKIAIISILVDSFAHNIAAHALSVIIEWLRRRVELLKQEYGINDLPLKLNNILNDILKSLKNSLEDNISIPKNLVVSLANEIEKNEVEEDIYWKDGKFNLLGIIKYGKELLRIISLTSATNARTNQEELLLLPVPLDDYMYKFLKYLEGKSTFWSGIIRETVLGGQIVNWYDLLLEFANNPLFIGTIAATEGIYTVEFYVKLSGNSGNNENTERNESEEQLFLTVDVSGMEEEKEKMGQIDYAFVKKGDNFDDIKEALKKKEVFLPGGEIGKHSLYTIFENILRNIKWTEKEIDNEQKIKFVIEIKDNDEKIYDINVWIENQTERNVEGEVEKIERKLVNSIIDKNGRPNLGGASQSKICACQLFTNVFDEVENKGLKWKGKDCYPWIKVKGEGKNNDKGYIIWSFKMWKGEKLGDFDESMGGGVNESKCELNENGFLIKNGEVIDNIKRYKIVVVKDEEKKKKVESLGVVRVVVKNDTKESNSHDNKFEEYYKKWLDEWLGEWKAKKGNLTIRKSSSRTAFILNNKWEWETKQEEISSKEYKINLAHKSSREGEFILYRNQGTFINSFLIKEINEWGETWKGINKDRNFELSEVLLTKIVIVDGRAYEIFETYKTETEAGNILWEQLNIEVYPEEKTLNNNIIWEKLKEKSKEIPLHFLIVHLGFLETLGYKEDNISEFIKNHITFYSEEQKNSSGNQKISVKKLVITTGRGRGKWLESLRKEEYAHNILFIPPEALINAMSKGVTIKDDFEIKYALVKLLMQS